MRPSAGVPTGMVIAPPVSTTSMPRWTPSVELMETARTWERPMCCCTSATRSISRPDSDWAVSLSALWISGSFRGSNCTSRTGPMTWTT